MVTYRLTQVRRDELDVTSGSVAEQEPGYLSITEPVIRATMRTGTAPLACLQFRYFWPTLTRATSGSGIEYHQVGLKLRSNNPCNLMYVMWRIQPKEELIVLVKRNPRQSTVRNAGIGGTQPSSANPFPRFVLGKHMS